MLYGGNCMKMDYSALIIDIIKSKSYEIDIRNEVQEYLTKCIKLLNFMYREMISCEVTFSAGDELQGLFKNPVAAVLYWRMLNFMVYPVQIRAGIGVGEWNVRIEGGLSTEQDGPAYHNSRYAIEDVYKRQMQSIRINSKSDKDVFANHLLNTSMGYKNGQNYMQNILQLVLELTYPFIEESRFIEVNDYAFKLLELKESFKVKENSFSRTIGRNQKRDPYINDIKIRIQDDITITGNIIDVEEIVYRKGTNSNIAEVMNKSRQNIDIVMKRGNIQLIRSMDYMALQYIKKYYGE